MNLYQVLELDYNASTKDIKKSFHALAKVYHPDKNKGEDSVFKNINLAYEILSDYELRKEYDSNLNNNQLPKGYNLLQDIINKNNLHIINLLFDFMSFFILLKTIL